MRFPCNPAPASFRYRGSLCGSAGGSNGSHDSPDEDTANPGRASGNPIPPRPGEGIVGAIGFRRAAPAAPRFRG